MALVGEQGGCGDLDMRRTPTPSYLFNLLISDEGWRENSEDVPKEKAVTAVCARLAPGMSICDKHASVFDLNQCIPFFE